MTSLPPGPIARSPGQVLLSDLALARSGLDRAAAYRTDASWLASRWADPATRVFAVSQGSALVPAASQDSDAPVLAAHPEADPSRIARPTLRLLAPPDAPTGNRLFLGTDPHSGTAYFAVAVGPDLAAPAGSRWANLREIGADLPDLDAGLLTTAVALDAWHTTHTHCPRCGHPTEAASGGWLRRCAADDSEHYPRTDPAVIMLVRDPADRALLGRQARWPAGWFSTLAGFVESGESAEAAVRREVAEEVAVTVTDVAYLGSQPWPFPSSLMLGYHAWTREVDLMPDGHEIAEARWFTRSELLAACESAEVRVPPSVSIARRLIEAWYGSPLPGAWSRP